VVNHLDTNYRSKKIIVDFVNRTFDCKIDDYLPQISYDKDDKGYVKVSSSDDVLEDLKKVLISLDKKDIPYKNIAILTFQNRDSLEAKEFLNREFPQIDTFTQTSSYLINRPNISAMIYLIKYIYFKQDIYKFYFLEILALKDITPDTKSLNIDMQLSSIVMFLIDEYALYDENALKFLEEIYKYEDIYEFIYEVELLETQIASESNLGIQIMTSHKSKGLEFDYVILLDRLHRKRGGTKSIFYDYDDVHIDRIFYKFSLREFFDDEYKEALQREKHKEDIDNINLLYVGFTRAKKALLY
jgi:exodeoxyribonuclease V beta subunit